MMHCHYGMCSIGAGIFQRQNQIWAWTAIFAVSNLNWQNFASSPVLIYCADNNLPVYKRQQKQWLAFRVDRHLCRAPFDISDRVIYCYCPVANIIAAICIQTECPKRLVHLVLKIGLFAAHKHNHSAKKHDNNKCHLKCHLKLTGEWT